LALYFGLRQLKVARGFLDNDENLPNITSFSLAYKHEGSLSVSYWVTSGLTFTELHTSFPVYTLHFTLSDHFLFTLYTFSGGNFLEGAEEIFCSDRYYRLNTVLKKVKAHKRTKVLVLNDNGKREDLGIGIQGQRCYSLKL